MTDVAFFIILFWPFFLFGGIFFLIFLIAFLVSLVGAISRMVSKRGFVKQLVNALIFLLLACVLIALAVFSFFRFYGVIL